MLANIFKTVDRLLYLIYPKTCIFCNSILNYGDTECLCSECVEKYKPISGNKCELCGRAIAVNNICGNCRSKKHYYDKCYCVYEYKDNVKSFIYAMKFSDIRQNCFYAAKQMKLYADSNNIQKCDYVVPVPMFSVNRIIRGYNQAELIARSFSRLTHGRYKRALYKCKITKPQHKLKGKERLINLKDVFKVSGNIKDKTILLIDDVFTTGSTVNECSRVLKKAGAKEVYVFCFCVVTDD